MAGPKLRKTRTAQRQSAFEVVHLEDDPEVSPDHLEPILKNYFLSLFQSSKFCNCVGTTAVTGMIVGHCLLVHYIVRIPDTLPVSAR